MSRILGCSPFDPIVLGHTEAQLDFILLMESDENPGTIVVSKHGQEVEASPTRQWMARETAWAKVLRGKALESRNPESSMTSLQEGIRRSREAHGGVAPAVRNLEARVKRGPAQE